MTGMVERRQFYYGYAFRGGNMALKRGKIYQFRGDNSNIAIFSRRKVCKGERYYSISVLEKADIFPKEFSINLTNILSLGLQMLV